MPSELTLESLQAQIKELTATVERQKQIIAKTGQGLLEIQLKQTQDKLKAINIPGVDSAAASGAGPNGSDMSDYVTNDDIVQLVGELQGQLTILEQRSLRRTINSTLTKGTQIIAPMLNSDGDEPEQGVWPVTLKEFENLSDVNVLKLCSFYELLPPTAKEEAHMKAFLDGDIDSPNVDVAELEFKPESYSKEVLTDLFDDLARFCGLQIRKSQDAW